MATYQKCGPNVENMALGLIREFETHDHLDRVRIDFLFAHAKRDDNGMIVGDAIRYRGGKALGLARKNSLKMRAAGRGDAEITLDGDWWEKASEPDQRALLDHELHHLKVVTNSMGVIQTDDLGRPKLKMRRHDFEFGWFAVIAMRHGEASQERQQANAMLEAGGQFLFPELVSNGTATRITRLEVNRR